MDLTPKEQLENITRIRLSLAKRGHPVKVLLVEDNENDATMTMDSLKNFSVDACWAKNSKEAEDYLVKNDPWLVFLDLKMSETDDGSLGLNILELIKSFKPSVYIFILTGVYDHSSPNCVKALEKGADAIWSKPLTVDQAKIIFTAP